MEAIEPHASLEDRITRVAWRLSALIAVAVGVWLVREQIVADDAAQRRSVQRVRLLDAPKPPPPPVEEKPLELLEPQKTVEVPKEPRAVDPGPKSSADNRLGLDADATGGGDDFGLAARRGGRDITRIGGGEKTKSDSGRDPAWYGYALQRHIELAFKQDGMLPGGEFKVVVLIWVAKDGTITRIKLSGSTNDPRVDEALRNRLLKLAPMRESPPEDMPQPIRMRITAHFVD